MNIVVHGLREGQAGVANSTSPASFDIRFAPEAVGLE
jgi:hypothetical protein